MINRIVQSADFERVLSAPSMSRSAHFVLHHLAQPPLPARKPARKPAPETAVQSFPTELSTGPAPAVTQAVDDLPGGHWLGCVVPKRHAKRAVTRSLLKRQIRSTFAAHAQTLPAGQWLVRLRAPFAPPQFISARSEALALAARNELEVLLSRVGAKGAPA
jgi:ribonuclease P protein component